MLKILAPTKLRQENYWKFKSIFGYRVKLLRSDTSLPKDMKSKCDSQISNAT